MANDKKKTAEVEAKAPVVEEIVAAPVPTIEVAAVPAPTPVVPVLPKTVKVTPKRTDTPWVGGKRYSFTAGKPIEVPSSIVAHLKDKGII